MDEYPILMGRNDDGSYIWLPGGEPVALHARTGAGKSVGFCIPNCFSWKGSLVVLDIKGEAFRATAGHRAAMGQDVYRFEPMSRTGYSHHWNPFSAIDRSSHRRYEQIGKQANLLFPNVDQVGAAANPNRFWEDSARMAFAGAVALLAESSEEGLTLDHVTRIFTRADGHDWMAEKVWQRRDAKAPYSNAVVDAVSDYLGQKGDDPRQRGGIRKSVSTGLQIWGYPQIAAVTARSDFDLRDLRRKPMTIYVVVAPGDIAMMKPLLRLFFDSAISLNTEATPEEDPDQKYQCLFLLDEFARLGRVDSLAQAAQYTRGYGLRMAYVVQSQAQLRAIYAEEAVADIFDNVGAEIIFGAADQKLLAELEQRLGDDTVMFTTTNRPRFMAWANPSKQGESEHPHKRPLMLDQEIARMSPAQQLILRPGMRPMITKRAKWHEDPNFRTRVKPPPYVPPINIQMPLDDGSTRITRPIQ
jgi:type IV secretion system protein VirD4